MVVLNVVMITLGQVIASGVDARPESSSVCSGSCPNHAIMGRIYAFATPAQVALKTTVLLRASVHQSIKITKSTTFFQRLKSMVLVPVNRCAPIVGCGTVQALQQLCGFNAPMYYSATLFKEIGFNQPTAVGLIISETNFLFTPIPLKYIGIVGRKKIMTISAPGMIFGLTLGASRSTGNLTKKTGGNLVDGTDYSTTWPAIVPLSDHLCGLGNVPWQQGELFGLEVRGIGTSTVARYRHELGRQSAHWVDVPVAHGKDHAGRGIRVIRRLCLLGWLFCPACFPETAGLSLGEVQLIFKDGFGIKESARARRQKGEMKIKEKHDADAN
ncbi:hypothetical protein FIBSPDRAFT_948247 [Athelia psychrophila]|uniref:Major facilitator superfamily (MFS) profile domain-containing protein n=1 Tax=Athelia psychrophila TaxID=1759441 RepID=A0A166QX58_9AGAM|nr:hypothetical protein FIBSPDRAFT_948247 [Fibularhizoctonia sp. CBS 109695]